MAGRSAGDGTPDEGLLPVSELREAGSISGWPEHHLAAIEPWQGGLRGLVSLYGALHVVRFDASAECLFNEPAVAICRQAGGETRPIVGERAAVILQVLREHGSAA